MEFAIAYPAKPDAWKDIVVAEDNGFSHAWLYDSQMIYSDVYACMALPRSIPLRLFGDWRCHPEQSYRSGDRPLHCYHQSTRARSGHPRAGNRIHRTQYHGPPAGLAQRHTPLYRAVPQPAQGRRGALSRQRRRWVSPALDSLPAPRPRLY